MPKNPLVLRLHEPLRAAALGELIREGKPEFTTVVSTKDAPVSAYDTVFLGLTPNRIDYLARVASGAKVATYERRISLSDFVEIDWDVEDWGNHIPVRGRARLVALLRDGGRFTDALWRDARAALLKAQPESGDAIKGHQLKTYHAGKAIDPDELETTLLEREAVAFALETWGGSRRRKETLLTASPITEPAPFLLHLNKVNIRENAAIEHDSMTIPGYKIIQKHIVGAAKFDGPNTSLTVLNVNLKPLETVLGVDLVYYNHLFRSFVLIQYKRMSSKLRSRPCYRPDADVNFQPECDRIDSWLKGFKALPRQTVGHRDFRIGTSPFFFKFCDLNGISALDAGLSPGFYLPYRLLKMLLKSKVARGPKGGKAIGWDTGRRYLSNKRMMELVEAGWIGSTGPVTAQLEQVMSSILTGNRSLIYAVTAPLLGGGQVYRNTLGQYSSDDDPLAHLELQ